METALRRFERNCCEYCSKELNREQWNSRWDPIEHEIHHYKVIRCDCGKVNWVKVDFDGSGHDSLFKKKVYPLESTVRKVREK